MDLDIYNHQEPMTLDQALSVYENLRPSMPQAALRSSQQAERLRDLLDQFDALLLDGYGVLNVGQGAIPGAVEMLKEAQSRGIDVMVLTNGASKPTAAAVTKYQGFGMDFAPEQVVSSRDALLAYLHQQPTGIKTLGVVDSFVEGVDVDGISCLPLRPDAPSAWLEVDAIGFFGAVDWHSGWQSCLVAAMAAGVKVLVANPDVTAPHEDAFSHEPGFWAAAAGTSTQRIQHIAWFGKPHPPVFELALQRLEAFSRRTTLNKDRIAMVGDSLHTDILGGQAAGLKTVLITGHGLFRHGGAEEAIAATGITPDFITATV